jgi:hypothetical protein
MPQRPALRTPWAIQQFLDDTPYSTDPFYRCPRRVLADRRAHCVDGALFAAWALERLGHRPLVLDMRAVRDDDHVIALYRRGRTWGAIAKSNVVGLRWREPIYRDVRELVMSYFEQYYNTDGEKTLRSYTDPIDLRRFDATGWRTRDDDIEPVIVRALDRARHHALLGAAAIRALAPVDERSYRAGLLGADAAGLYAADRLKIAVAR